MSRINTVIFDLDGTLLYTLTDLLDATNYGLRKTGLPERSLEEVRRFVGNGIQKLMERAVPQGTDEEVLTQALDAFRDYYALHCTDHTEPYDGVLDLVARLDEAGYRLAIVSNKVDSAVKDLNRTFFAEHIHVAIGEREGVRKKPAPDTVYEALKELGSKKEEAVYIGDSDVDLATAANAGLPCISVLWGFRDRSFLVGKGAEHFAETPDDVLRLIEEFQALLS